MKIVKIKGGLGNQMFQYAFAKRMEKETKDCVKLDFSLFDTLFNDNVRKPRILKFNLSLEAASKEEIEQVCMLKHSGNGFNKSYKAKILLENIINKKYFFEKNRAYRDIKKLRKIQYFDGYWQSWRYVEPVIEVLKSEYCPKDKLSVLTQETIKKIKQENSVFIGVRRGDYIAETSHYGSFGQAYYHCAMKYMEERIKEPVYYIFSDDIEWVKNNLNFGKRNIVFREKRDIVSDFEELVLMMNCRHSIIVNSTYHWWGARMNFYPEKIVIAPKKWFFDNKPIDIVPPCWVRI